MGAYCPFCGSDVDPDQAQPGSLPGTVHCPTCRQEIDLPGSSPVFTPPPVMPAMEQAPPPLPGPPWEGEGGFFARLLHTTGQVLFHPVRFFSAPARPGYAWALSYGLILGTLGQACNVFWGHALGNDYVSLRSAILGLIFAPFLVIITTFVTTWVVHFCLWILRGTSNGVQATFRVMAYGQATALLLAVPYVGVALAAVWGLVVAIGGLAAAHGTGRWRAFWSLFLPMILFFGIIMAVVLIMLAVGVGSVFLEHLRGLPGSI
ncbi:MAG: YIP1 family protein [Deltaproteobacteria bacterium]|nr:YIP1 family protein [Deltaproteobacteria bacterium]